MKIEFLINNTGELYSFKTSNEIEIDTVAWPKTCLTIPQSCFDNSSIRNVEGIEQVNKIESCAFYSTQLKRFSWPEGVSATETSAFLAGCENLEEIRFEGTGIRDVDLEYFFSLKSIKKIDLSGCSAVNLLGTDTPEYAEFKRKLLLPYYVTEVS